MHPSLKVPTKEFPISDLQGAPIEELGDLDSHRERIRALEKENASIQRQYQATKMSMVQGELAVKALRSQVDSLQWELAQQREELDAARKACEGQQCIVCMEEVASHVVVPCGHLALCQRCSGLASSRCPLCRQTAERVIGVFRL